jgi:hypothetical protein
MPGKFDCFYCTSSSTLRFFYRHSNTRRQSVSTQIQELALFPLPLPRVTMKIMTILSVSYSIPYTCQFASPELVHDLIYKQIPLEQDPHWADYGAVSPQEYAHWAVRSCGVVCVKMVVEGITGKPSGTVMDWVKAGLALDGYITDRRTDRSAEVGWKHTMLARLATRHGCQAELVSGQTLNDLAGYLRTDRLLIASVTSELGENVPLTRRNGHLVVVYGLKLDEQGEVESITLHNPSGRTAALQVGAIIPAERFAAGFSGRGIIVGAAH